MTSIATMTSPNRHVVVLAPRGELGLEQGPPLRAALRGAADGARLVVLDLLDVSGVQPPVVEVLVGAAASCAARGVQFVVANADRQPWTALTQARLADVLRVHRRGAEPLAELLQLLEL